MSWKSSRDHCATHNVLEEFTCISCVVVLPRIPAGTDDEKLHCDIMLFNCWTYVDVQNDLTMLCKGSEDGLQFDIYPDTFKYSLSYQKQEVVLSGKFVTKMDLEMVRIPIKVNVLAWKISMDRLPTRVNLHRRGVHVSLISCPICCEALENLDHLLFCCDLAKDIARSICNWWGLVWNPVDSYRSWLSWFNLVQLQSSSKQVLEGVFYTSWRKLIVPDHPCFIHPDVAPHDVESRPDVVLGLGFDPITNDYKNQACFVDGALHWVVKYSGKQDHFIMTFHLSSHVFGTIALPESMRNTRQITVINGSLAVISRYDDKYHIFLCRQYMYVGHDRPGIVKGHLVGKPFLGRKRKERVKTGKVQTLKAEFETLSMKDTEIIDDFAMKVNNIVSNIRALGKKVEEAYVVKKLLRAVPSKFLQIASTIEQFADLDTMTIEEVIGRLKAHEERVRGKSEIGEGKLLLTHQEWLERSKKGDDEQKNSQRNTRSSASNNRGRGRGRGRGNGSGNRGGRGRGGGNQQRDGYRGFDKNHDKSKVQCYNCQQYGHYAAECRNPRRERNQEANLTQENNDGEPVLLLPTFDEDDRVQEVFLNVTPRLKLATDVGGDTSLWQLAEGGDQIIMHGSFLWVHDVKGKLPMKVRRSPNRLYKIQLEEVKSRCLLRKSDEEVKLWHTRMHHVNYAALKLMSDKEMVQGLPKITKQNGLCEWCLTGKQAQKSFPTHSNFMSTMILELVHGDLCGPISPPTPAGNMYFLLLVDLCCKMRKGEPETLTFALSFLKLSWRNVSLAALFLVVSSSLFDLRKRVKKLDKKRRSKSSGLKRLRKDVTLVDVDTAVEMDVDTYRRMEKDVTAIKEVNVAEPTVFDDEDVTMTMAQTLIKMKAEKARILDEQMAKRLQDDETEQAAARENRRKKT
nr:hypothetical protein [Tanacetum cinerariifolium]